MAKVRVKQSTNAFQMNALETDISSWSDIQMSADTKIQVEEFQHQIQSAEQPSSLESFSAPQPPKALFTGTSGTGKTMAASLLGKTTHHNVYQVDLSKVISKHIGETEKNIDALFKDAEENGWILFFDEADAIFGKRTIVKDAHDKYANLESNYLMQKIDDYKGVVILSADDISDVDDAVIQKFKSVDFHD